MNEKEKEDRKIDKIKRTGKAKNGAEQKGQDGAGNMRKEKEIHGRMQAHYRRGQERKGRESNRKKRQGKEKERTRNGRAGPQGKRETTIT